ncbi:glycosyltransferase [Paenibacillus alvei]|uniref:glycosyltransferase n=1 Tax=Paenibacillus alvei TaxID=44250 RepID=UPI002280338B|nr:glycosyltransferase [Paenibacillus alvei]
MKKIVLASEGSNGDLFPMLALANELMRLGHDVVVCAPPNNDSFVRKCGFQFIPIGVDFQALLQEHADKVMGKNPMRIMKLTVKLLREQVQRHISQLKEAAIDADIMIASGVMYAARSVAEYYRIPFRLSVAIPQVLPSRSYPPLLINALDCPQWVNRFLWWGDSKFQNRMILKTLNEERGKLGLPPVRDIQHYLLNDIIIPADPVLEPVRANPAFRFTQTAYWHFEDGADLDPSISQFIEEGDPPVFIGFGSSTDPDPLRTRNILNEVIEKSGQRFIILKGWAELGTGLNHANVRTIDFAPYLKLFPKMGAIIHHGGSGTTHCAARSGVPQIIIPHAMDQYRWGSTIAAKKLGPDPINRSKLTADKLLHAIKEAVTNPEFKKQASQVGHLMRQKNGVEEFIRQFPL